MRQIERMKKDAGRALAGHRWRAAAAVSLAVIPGLTVGALEQTLRIFSGIPAFFEAPSELLRLRNAAPLSVLISVLTLLLGFLVSAPMRQGLCRWYCLLGGSQQPPLSEIFFYFEKRKNFFCTVALRLGICLRMGMWAAILFAPPGILLWMLLWGYTPGERAGVLGRLQPLVWLIFGLWVLLSALLLSVAAMRYLPASFLLAQAPGQKAGRVLRRSARLMNGHKAKALLFCLSFAGWYIPAISAAAAVSLSLFFDIYYLGFGIVELVAVCMVLQMAICLFQRPYFYAAHIYFLSDLIAEAELQSNPQTREYLYHAQLQELLAEQRNQKDIDLEDENSLNDVKTWPAGSSGVC